ncbi:MAG: hypothetical protein ACOCRK_00700, partial [bacterium]
ISYTRAIANITDIDFINSNVEFKGDIEKFEKEIDEKIKDKFMDKLKGNANKINEIMNYMLQVVLDTLDLIGIWLAVVIPSDLGLGSTLTRAILYLGKIIGEIINSPKLYRVQIKILYGIIKFIFKKISQEWIDIFHNREQFSMIIKRTLLFALDNPNISKYIPENISKSIRTTVENSIDTIVNKVYNAFGLAYSMLYLLNLTTIQMVDKKIDSEKE